MQFYDEEGIKTEFHE